VVPRAVRDFGSIRVDTTDWPVLVMGLPELRFEDSDLEMALAYIGQIMRECEKDRDQFCQITDAGRVHAMPPASQRTIIAEWARDTAALQKTATIGGVVVTPSSIIRGLVNALLWLYKPHRPLAFLATRDEAMLLAIQWLEEARVRLPPRLHEMRDELKRKHRSRPSSGP
jgi:hypothetical protein